MLKKTLERVNTTYCSGLTFLNHVDFSASSAVILLSGSNSSILSNKSNAGVGINMKSSRSLLRCTFFTLSVLNSGSFMTLGQTAGIGEPHTLDIVSN